MVEVRSEGGREGIEREGRDRWIFYYEIVSEKKISFVTGMKGISVVLSVIGEMENNYYLC